MSDAGSDRVPAGRRCASRMPATATVPPATGRIPVIASASSRWPFPATPAIPTISPARTSRLMPRSASPPRSPSARTVDEREDSLAELSDALGPPGPLDLPTDHQRRERLRRRRRPSRPSRPTGRPRSTVTRSETFATSCNLCEMKMTVRPSSAIARIVAEERLGLLRRQHRGRLVEDEEPGIAVERLDDLDALLLADRELPDPCATGRSRARSAPPSSATRRSTRIAMEPERPPDVAVVAEHDVLRHGEGLDEAEVLVHHADPRLERLPRRVEADGCAVDAQLARIGLVQPGEDVRERALAGPVLAEERVHLTRRGVEVDVLRSRRRPGKRFVMPCADSAAEARAGDGAAAARQVEAGRGSAVGAPPPALLPTCPSRCPRCPGRASSSSAGLRASPACRRRSAPCRSGP